MYYDFFGFCFWGIFQIWSSKLFLRPRPAKKRFRIFTRYDNLRFLAQKFSLGRGFAAAREKRFRIFTRYDNLRFLAQTFSLGRGKYLNVFWVVCRRGKQKALPCPCRAPWSQPPPYLPAKTTAKLLQHKPYAQKPRAGHQNQDQIQSKNKK